MKFFALILVLIVTACTKQEMNPETVLRDFVVSVTPKNIKSDGFKVLSKTCKEAKCSITYSISYVTLAENKAQFATEVKKIVELVQIENKWLIADVSNLKTYHESLEPINAIE